MTTRTRLLLAALSLTAAALVLWGCSQTTPSEPLGPTAPDGIVVAGTVTDTDGRRAAGAVIAAEPLTAGLAAAVAAHRDPESALAAKAATASAVSDADGRFVVSGLDAGRWLLTTSLRNHQGDSRQLLVAASVGTTFVDIQLTPTGTLTGIATLENAAQHHGTVVYVEGTSYLAVTDGNGAYAMTDVPVGAWNVRAFHAGWLDDTTTGALTTAGEVDTLPDLFLPLASNIAPVVDGIDVTVAAAGQSTQFTVQAHDDDGTVVHYEWDFQDDGVWDADSATSGNASFIYTATGPVTAKLRITDDDGAVGLAAVTFDVPAVAFQGVFVAVTGDDGGAGTADDPLLTINAAIGLAAQQGAADVWIAAGDYVEDVTIVNGISLHGGRTGAFWDRDPLLHSRVTGASQGHGAVGVSASTLVEGMEFTAGNATGFGQASVAMTLLSCSPNLVFDDCIFQAGQGSVGRSGTHGNPGAAGTIGGSGAPGSCDALVFAPGGNGGSGGLPGGSGGAGGQENQNGQ
ncbi:carboxypeptidase regulatory-like domain-containing protein, partial [bacterium]|nr:carboxypeptidase regulatory-like domain-containing protein [bacterium]